MAKVPKRLVKLKNNLNYKTLIQATEKAFKLDYIQDFLIESVQDRLKKEGTDSQNKKLRTDTAIFRGEQFYSSFTQGLKGINRSQHVTLHDEGSFYRSMDVVVGKTFYKVKAEFEKDNGNIYDNFTNSYSNESDFENAILNLTSSDFKIFINKIFLPAFKTIYLNDLLK